VEVLFEDDGTDEARTVPPRAVSSSRKTCSRSSARAVPGSRWRCGRRSSARDPAGALAGGSVITDEFSEWVFQTPWPNRIVVPFILRQLKESGVNVSASSPIPGHTARTGTITHGELVDEFGIEIVADEQFNRGDADMTRQLTKIRGADPDAILMWAAGAEAATLLKNHESLIGMDDCRFRSTGLPATPVWS
jgi:branched-chain amino acid transport system substrate-binding protein